MAREVPARRSQVEAAKVIVERDSAMGRSTPEAIRKIAEAEPESSVVNENTLIRRETGSGREDVLRREKDLLRREKDLIQRENTLILRERDRLSRSKDSSPAADQDRDKRR